MVNDLGPLDGGHRVAVPSGVELWVYEDGDPSGDAVVLLAGADCPGFRWPATLVESLVAQGRRVVRFDHRDCGRSTRFSAADAYRLQDLATDTVGLLDALDIDEVDVIGRSMGGMVGQLLALDHPTRVRTLTLVSTTAAPGSDDLPGPTDDFVAQMTERLFAGPPSDPAAQVTWLVGLDELLAGTRFPFDRPGQRRLAEHEVATGWEAETGHGVAVHGSPAWVQRIGEIAVPTLVVHGRTDPVFPVEHGRLLASRIEGAQLVEIDDLGHDAPAALWDELDPVLRDHLGHR